MDRRGDRFYSEPVTDLTIIDLDSAPDDPALVTRTYQAVLRPSFTVDELSGVEAVLPGEGRVLSVAVDSDGVPVAAAVTELGPKGVSLLGYLAVSPAARGLGAGGRLMAHLIDSWRSQHYPLVVAEVHDPRGHADAEDEHPEARLRFYGRAGAEVLDVPWVQPALAEGARVPDMLLLALHRETDEPEPAIAEDGLPSVPSAVLLAWALQYFIEAEGGAPVDPQGLALLARFGAADRIAVLPLDAWRQIAPLAVD